MTRTPISLALTLILFGCDSDSDDANTSSSSVSLEEIVGVWDSSTYVPGYGQDEFYTVINSDGTFNSYDYLGDEFDDLLDCYYVEEIITSATVSKVIGSDNEFEFNVLSELEFDENSISLETSFNYFVSVVDGDSLQLELSSYETDYAIREDGEVTELTASFTIVSENEVVVSYTIENQTIEFTYDNTSGEWPLSELNEDIGGLSDIIDVEEFLGDDGQIVNHISVMPRSDKNVNDLTPLCSELDIANAAALNSKIKKAVSLLLPLVNNTL